MLFWAGEKEKNNCDRVILDVMPAATKTDSHGNRKRNRATTEVRKKSFAFLSGLTIRRFFQRVAFAINYGKKEALICGRKMFELLDRQHKMEIMLIKMSSFVEKRADMIQVIQKKKLSATSFRHTCNEI